MTSSTTESAAGEPAAAHPVTSLGAAELASRIAGGVFSAAEVTEAFLDRIQVVNPQFNALVHLLADEARRDARRCDEAAARGRSLGPLHGVPVTVKECFAVRGTATTLGMPGRAGQLQTSDGPPVEALREAGAVILGKTNVPQMMLLHETDNPLFGQTSNPWNPERTPGGSSGGEAAVIAAGGSPLGLGSDLGGSIRMPAHFCGITGIKPTSRLLTKRGTAAVMHGMEAVQFVIGPMARRVDDLTLCLRVLCSGRRRTTSSEEPPVALSDPAGVDVAGLRIALWTDDGLFPASPAVRRAVEESAAALEQMGANVETYTPPEVAQMMRLYLGLLSADGAADTRREAHGEPLDWRIRRLKRLGTLSRPMRAILRQLLSLLGERRTAEMLRLTGRISADRYWQLSWQRREYEQRFMEDFQGRGFDALLCPPYALPAPRHGHAIDLLPAAGYAFLPNILGIPAGTVPVTRVRAGEESDRPASRDRVDRRAAETEEGSAGLPIGVQVAAPHWREDVVLAVMKRLEEHFRLQPDLPEIA